MQLLLTGCIHLCKKNNNLYYLHLDVKDASLLLNLLLDSSHGLVEDRQALRALQSGGGHHVTRRSDQVDLTRNNTTSALLPLYPRQRHHQ